MTPPRLLVAWVSVEEDILRSPVMLCGASGVAASMACAAPGLPVERLTVVTRLFITS